MLSDQHIRPCPLLQCWSDRETVCDCQEALLLQKSGNTAYIYQFDHICSRQLKIDQNCRDLQLLCELCASHDHSSLVSICYGFVPDTVERAGDQVSRGICPV